MLASKYAGTCSDCGSRFPAGTLIEYDRRAPRGRKAKHADCNNPEIVFERATIRASESDDSPAAWNEREAKGLGHPRRRARTVSYEVTTSGGTFYRNRAGRCEDAPCCGCCTF